MPSATLQPSSTAPGIMALEYRDTRHEELPHVVKFSGGRSSAALVLALAEAGGLRPERGDVVLFANTSAEHPGTYEFAAECCERLEAEHALPCLWYEFCTVEDSSRGAYRRRQSYRLVSREPFDPDVRPEGYRAGGEAFEEMLSYQGMLPNPHSRSCTAKLKLYPAHLLLAEWLGGADGPRHDGHYGERAYFTVEAAARRYRGNASEESYRRRVQYMIDCAPSRPTQRWSDFTSAPIVERPFHGPAGSAPMWGPDAAQFVTLLGLRGDEERRVTRVLSRSLFAEGAGGRECSIRTQPPGERPYFPLFDAGWSEADVNTFWREREFALGIPQGAGNCVYCFMKGTRDLQAQAQIPDPVRVADAPSDIAWWDGLEQRYRREAPSRDGRGTSRFGFFGVHGPSFAEIADPDAELKGRYTTGAPSCDCTD